MKASCIAALLLALAACSRPMGDAPAETVHAAPIALVAHAQGELKSAKATALLVPGPQWSQRQLVWMLPEGSAVRKGQVVARFASAEGRMQLTQAMADLERNALAQAGKRQDLESVHGRLDVDLSQVAIDLAIARRYANMPLQMYSRDKLLDAVQDENFLGAKQSMLEWKRGQSGQRGASELAVLAAQRDTLATSAKTLRGNLDALELLAPHDGVIVLKEDWSGEKPQLGGNFWAGFEFGSLPDVHALEVELALPQLDAQGVQVGDAVELYPVGRPGQAIASRVSWVASAAQLRDRGDPAKYIVFKAGVPAQDALRFGWVPGQRFEACVFVGRSRTGITVPNLALATDSGRTFVTVLTPGGTQRREVTLGARGTARSEVTRGLENGERVLLLPRRAGGKS